MKPRTKLRIWLIKKLAGDMGIVVNLKAVSFKQQYNGQPIYGINTKQKISKQDRKTLKN